MFGLGDGSIFLWVGASALFLLLSTRTAGELLPELLLPIASSIRAVASVLISVVTLVALATIVFLFLLPHLNQSNYSFGYINVRMFFLSYFCYMGIAALIGRYCFDEIEYQFRVVRSWGLTRESLRTRVFFRSPRSWSYAAMSSASLFYIPQIVVTIELRYTQDTYRLFNNSDWANGIVSICLLLICIPIYFLFSKTLSKRFLMIRLSESTRLLLYISIALICATLSLMTGRFLIINYFGGDATSYLARGNARYENHEYSNAASDYSEAVRRDPMLAEALVGKANTSQDSSKKMEYYNRAIEINPHLAGAFYNRGLLFYDLHRFPEAEKDFKNAIVFDETDADAHFMLGIILYQQRMNDDALKELQESIRLGTSQKKQAEEYVKSIEEKRTSGRTH